MIIFEASQQNNIPRQDDLYEQKLARSVFLLPAKPGIETECLELVTPYLIGWGQLCSDFCVLTGTA